MPEDIIINYKDGVRIITLNRPEKKNALNGAMYQTITRVLNEDASNDDIVVTIITGTGSYFTSGNDLKSAMTENTTAKSGLNNVKLLVDAFITYPKLLIAVVNGPAIGIGATLLALCDITYATENATFDTPFLKLGLCAEAASSFTFPLILGKSKALEMLLLNHKLTAQEAYAFGFVSKVIPQSAVSDFIKDLYKYGKLPVESLKVNKRLIMANLKPILYECNNREIEQLKDCVESQDFSNAIMSFLSKNSKL